MRPLALTLAATTSLTLLSSFLLSNMTGVPGPGYANTAPSCGTVLCHGAAVGVPGGNNIAVSIAPTARSLTLGQAISVTTSVTGGATGPGNPGGFNSFISRGRFTVGTGTAVGFSGTDITHTDSTRRSWTYGYTASTTITGLVNMWAACNTGDGDLLAGPGDIWAFHNFDSTSTTSTPVRLYVNAARVRPFGSSCVGSYGQYPVFGAPQQPNLGSATFSFELNGAAPSAPMALLIGANPSWVPLDLTFINITGCTLWVDPTVSISLATGAGDAKRAEGTASIPLPIPSSGGLSGAKLQAQIAIIDFANGRGVPVTMTNALELTLQ